MNDCCCKHLEKCGKCLVKMDACAMKKVRSSLEIKSASHAALFGSQIGLGAFLQTAVVQKYIYTLLFTHVTVCHIILPKIKTTLSASQNRPSPRFNAEFASLSQPGKYYTRGKNHAGPRVLSLFGRAFKGIVVVLWKC